MDFKGQTAVLSVIFVLVGMMFLVPTITDKALAGVDATATEQCFEHTGQNPPDPCQFTLVGSHLDSGKWTSQPTQSGTRVTWSTTGGVGNEKGSVTYDVSLGPGRTKETAVLSFDNPLIGDNECGVKGIAGWCTAGKGMNAEFAYNLVLGDYQGYYAEPPPHNK
jgi:hypothetical protein